VIADGLIICPTRRRRGSLGGFVEAFAATREAHTDLLVAVDHDDTDTYAGLKLPPWARFAVAPREWLTPKLNRWAVPAANVYPAVGFAGDDSLPASAGWDAALFAALGTPGIAVPVSTTGSRADGVGEHQVVSSVIVRALGWYFLPSTCHYYTDNAWADLGRELGIYRTVHAAVLNHYRAAPPPGGQRDETYARAEVNGPADGAAFREWRYGDGFGRDLATVRVALGLECSGRLAELQRLGYHVEARIMFAAMAKY
jgi:hypothetical protein